MSWMEEDESTGRCLNLEKLGEILRGKIVDSFKCKEEDLVNDAVFQGEPMKLVQDRCYVMEAVLVMMRAAEFWTSCSLWMDLSGKP